jgi:hypothetical protein
MKNECDTNRPRRSVVGLLTLLACFAGQGSAQAPASDAASSASPELVGQLTTFRRKIADSDSDG